MLQAVKEKAQEVIKEAEAQGELLAGYAHCSSVSIFSLQGPDVADAVAVQACLPTLALPALPPATGATEVSLRPCRCLFSQAASDFPSASALLHF